jgi:hypothetical protein
MTKELLIIEFRYNDKPKSEFFGGYKTKTVTIGVFDTIDEAIVESNKVLEILESKFKLHVFPKGNLAIKDRFSLSNRLISNLAYLQTPFDFYAKIKTLKYEELEQTIINILEANKRYIDYKKQECED